MGRYSHTRPLVASFEESTDMTPQSPPRSPRNQPMSLRSPHVDMCARCFASLNLRDGGGYSLSFAVPPPKLPQPSQQPEDLSVAKARFNPPFPRCSPNPGPRKASPSDMILRGRESWWMSGTGLVRSMSGLKYRHIFLQQRNRERSRDR